MQEHKEEGATGEEEGEDDGPPPGFQCIINPRPLQAERVEADDDEDEEGPPPGFHSIVPKPPPSGPPSDNARSSKQDDDDDDDDDGPPPGWEFRNLVNALPKPLSNEADMKMESNEDLDEGPPPGWETVLTNQMPPPRTPPLEPSSVVSSEIEMGSKQIITRVDDEVPPSVSQCPPLQGHSSPDAPPVHKLPSSELPGDTGNKEDKRIADKKHTSVLQPASPLKQLPPTQHPVTPAPGPSSSGAEKAQLVCGTCRKLCLYPRGTKLVKCPGCQEVNFVLEAHEVGQVKCGQCDVLLMYSFGAPAVQCSSCRFVTEIGAHNRRPPLSVQQAQRRRRPNRAR